MNSSIFDMPDTSISVLEAIRHYEHADFAYENLVKELSAFQSSLDDQHEVGVLFVGFSREILMCVKRIGFQNPNLLYFYGTVNERESELIQHISQLNFLLTSIPTDGKAPRRIGFSID
jgi:hypothetical protein